MIAPLQSSPSHNSSSTTIANEQAPSSHRGDESAILRSLSLNTRALLAAPHMERSRSLPERGSPNGEQSWSTFPPSRTAEHTRKTPSQQRILLHSQSTNTSASSGSEANAVEAGSSNSKRGEKRLKKSSSKRPPTASIINDSPTNSGGSEPVASTAPRTGNVKRSSTKRPSRRSVMDIAASFQEQESTAAAAAPSSSSMARQSSQYGGSTAGSDAGRSRRKRTHSAPHAPTAAAAVCQVLHEREQREARKRNLHVSTSHLGLTGLQQEHQHDSKRSSPSSSPSRKKSAAEIFGRAISLSSASSAPGTTAQDALPPLSYFSLAPVQPLTINTHQPLLLPPASLVAPTPPTLSSTSTAAGSHAEDAERKFWDGDEEEFIKRALAEEKEEKKFRKQAKEAEYLDSGAVTPQPIDAALSSNGGKKVQFKATIAAPSNTFLYTALNESDGSYHGDPGDTDPETQLAMAILRLRSSATKQPNHGAFTSIGKGTNDSLSREQMPRSTLSRFRKPETFEQQEQRIQRIIESSAQPWLHLLSKAFFFFSSPDSDPTEVPSEDASTGAAPTNYAHTSLVSRYVDSETRQVVRRSSFTPSDLALETAVRKDRAHRRRSSTAGSADAAALDGLSTANRRRKSKSRSRNRTSSSLFGMTSMSHGGDDANASDFFDSSSGARARSVSAPGSRISSWLSLPSLLSRRSSSTSLRSSSPSTEQQDNFYNLYEGEADEEDNMSEDDKKDLVLSGLPIPAGGDEFKRSAHVSALYATTKDADDADFAMTNNQQQHFNYASTLTPTSISPLPAGFAHHQAFASPKWMNTLPSFSGSPYYSSALEDIGVLGFEGSKSWDMQSGYVAPGINKRSSPSFKGYLPLPNHHYSREEVAGY